MYWISRLLPAWMLVVAGAAVAADVVPDGGTSTTLDTAQNGVTTVNIAPPNADGVSRNTYTNYSVDNTGVILNNSDSAGVSQLGGALLPNSQFEIGMGASIILNEVTSTNPSLLNGYNEVFGRQAQFILANPNGITCDGCGFINTSRATLITGSENNPTGAVGLFNLGPGSLSITGAGLNGNNVSYVDLISRVVSIQANLQAADRIGIYTGNHQYNYVTREVTSLAGVGAPTYSIDAGLLGSMYANTIELVATEAGVGVRTQGLLNAQNTINAQALGEINTAGAEAGNTIYMRGNTITQNGDYLAGNTIDLEADTLTLLNRVESDINTRLVQRVGNWTLGDLYTGTGLTELVAQNGTLTFSGKVSAGGDLSVSASNIDNQNTVAARRNVTLSTSGNLTNGDNGLVFAGNNLQLLVDGTLTNRGQLYSQGTLSATNRSDGRMLALLNQGGRIESTGAMTLKAETLQNTHNMPVDTAPTDFTQTDRPVIRIDDGVVNGVQNWHEEINPALKRGLIQTNSSLTIDANTVTNNLSDIYAGGAINISAAQLDNRSYTLQQTTTDSYQVWQKVGQTCPSLNLFGWCVLGWQDVYAWVTYYQPLQQDTATTIPATIQAGGAMTLNVSGAVNNNGSVLSNTAPASTSVTDPLAGMTLPGEGGFFVPNPSPSVAHPYLIETDPALIDVGTLFGSDYFLDRVGYVQTEDLTLFLGDAFYDQRVISEQIRLLSGQRFLFADAQSDNEQYQRLVEQAAVERERLGLEVGIALTDEQVAALEQSIVWYVEVDYQGQKVLAPRIYLVASDKSPAPGATLAANEININAGNVLNEGVILSQSALTINADGDIRNRSGIVQAGEDLNLVAGGDINNDTFSWYREHGGTITSGVHRTASFVAGGDMNLQAANNIGLHASTLSAGRSAQLVAGGGVTIDAQELVNRTNWSNTNLRGLTDKENRDMAGASVAMASFGILAPIGGANLANTNYTHTETTHATSSVDIGGNLRIQTGKDIFMEAASVTAAGNIDFDAAGSINMVSVQDSVEDSKSHTKQSGWFIFGSTETTTETSKHTTSHGTSVAGGGDLSVTSGGNVLLHGSRLASGGDASITTRGGDILLLADRNSSSERYQRSKEDLISEESQDRGSYREQLAASSIQSGGHLSFDTAEHGRAGDVVLSGATVSSENGMRFGGYESSGRHSIGDDDDHHDDESGRIQNLRIESAALQDQQWDYQHRGLKGWAAFIAAGVSGLVGGDGIEIERTRNTRTDRVNQQGSNVATAGDLAAYTSGDITISGSNVMASGKGRLDAQGGVTIESVLTEEHNQSTNSHTTASGLSFKSDNRRVSVGIDGEYRKEEIDETLRTNQASNLQFGGDLDIRSAGSTNVAASNLYSEQNINVDADGGINVLSADDLMSRATKNTEADARVSVGVGNAYNDIHQSVEDYKRAQENRRSAEQALRDFDAEIRQMQADMEKGLVTADDIRLRREDRKYYEANVALAMVNEASSLVAIGQSGARAAAAASSSYGTGFYADVKFEIEGRESDKEEKATQVAASQIVAGHDINFNSGRDIHIQGSDLSAKGDITLEATNDLLIEAGRNAQSKNENRKSVSYSMSYGTNSGGSWDAGANTGFDRAQNTSWRNATVGAGGTLTLRSGNDTTLAGANAQGQDVVAEVGGDLLIQSRQNTSNTAGQDAGFSIGTGTIGVNGGNRNQVRRWVDNTTTLTGRDSVTVRTKGDTQIVGAVLAQIDEEGRDGGKLSLSTRSLSYRDIQDYDNASNWSAGFSTSTGSRKNVADGGGTPNSGKTSIQANMGGHVYGQVSRATLGQGTIDFTGEGEAIPEGLNRDIDALTKVTANRNTGGLNANVTIDHRLVSKAGWRSIGRDFKDTGQFGKDIAAAIEKISTNEKLKLSNLGQVIRNNAGVTLALNDISRDPKLAHILDDLKSDDPVSNQRGWIAFGNILQSKYGIKPSDINFYNANVTAPGSLRESGQGIWGATVTDSSSSENRNIFINVAGPYVNQRRLGITLGHEVGESGYATDKGYMFFADSDTQREALNDQLGLQVVSRLEGVESGIFVSGSQSSWASGLANSGYTFAGQNRANSVGYANVQYRHLSDIEKSNLDDLATDFMVRMNIPYDQSKSRLTQQAKRLVSFDSKNSIPEDVPALNYLRGYRMGKMLQNPDGSYVKDAQGSVVPLFGCSSNAQCLDDSVFAPKGYVPQRNNVKYSLSYGDVGTYVGNAVTGVPGAAWDSAKGVYKLVTSPVETVKNIPEGIAKARELSIYNSATGNWAALGRDEGSPTLVDFGATVMLPGLTKFLPETGPKNYVTIRTYTNAAGREGISESGYLRAETWVTLPEEIPSKAGHLQIEKILEIQPGRGTSYLELEVPKTKLRVPDNGTHTSGGALQYQLKEPVPINPKSFKRPPGRPGSKE